MADSPLDFFRRHKGLVMGTMLLSMILFVVGGSLTQFTHGLGFGGRSPAHQTVFTWSGGTVDENEMMQMRRAHRIAAQFTNEIVRATYERKGISRGRAISPADDERVIVQTLILAEKAKKLGVVVDDEAVITYLNDLCGFSLTSAEITEIADRVGSKQLTQAGILEQLKHELLAQHVLLMMQPDGAVSLGEAWDYHNRLHRQVDIEAYPVVVKDFVAKVDKEPTEQQKREFFDKYKLNLPDPQSPDPGFFRPAKLSFDYLKVDFAPFLDAAKKDVTEEQIKTEYDTGVARNRFKVEDKPEEKKSEDGKPEAGKTEDGNEKKPEGEEKPADKKPEDKKTEETPPADKKDEDKAAEGTGPKECFQDDPKEPAPKKEEPAKPADPAKPAETDPAKPADPAKPETGPANPADPAKPADTVPADPTQPVPPKPEKPEVKMRVQTLDEVKEQIRTELAQPKAQEAMQKVLDAAIKEITDYAEKHQLHADAKLNGDKTEELKPLDVKELGAKYGFTPGSIELKNRFEIGDTELGKDAVFMRDFNAQDFDPSEGFFVSFARMVYGNRLQDYQPQMARSSKSMADVEYLFWITGSKTAEQPKFEDEAVQKEIVAAWKLQQAYELAKKEAADLAERAKGKESLKEIFSEEEQKKILTPPAFSWFNLGSMSFGSQVPMISTVEGVELPGQEFMEPVCTAKVGDVVTGPNFPHTHVYVVKVLGQKPPEDELRSRFADSGIGNENMMRLSPIQMLAARQKQYLFEQKIDELVKEYALEWNRAPNAPIGEGS